MSPTEKEIPSVKLGLADVAKYAVAIIVSTVGVVTWIQGIAKPEKPSQENCKPLQEAIEKLQYVNGDLVRRLGDLEAKQRDLTEECQRVVDDDVWRRRAR